MLLVGASAGCDGRAGPPGGAALQFETGAAGAGRWVWRGCCAESEVAEDETQPIGTYEYGLKFEVQSIENGNRYVLLKDFGRQKLRRRVSRYYWNTFAKTVDSLCYVLTVTYLIIVL